MQSNHPAPMGLSTPSADLAEAIKRGYEPKDINLKGLFIFLAVLVLVLIVVLFVIYGITMFLVENDRSHDPLGSPVTVVAAEQYAPLQPSVGHNTFDTDDMAAMREHTQQVLTSESARQMPIDQAITATVALLQPIVKPAVGPVAPPAGYVPPPPGSHEGSPIGVRVGSPEAKAE